jgi:hypothetical protein
MPAVEAACAEAIAHGAHSADVVSACRKPETSGGGNKPLIKRLTPD